MIELIEFLDDRTRSPFADWRDGLDASVRVRIEISLARMRSGNLSALKGVGSGVLEMRLDFGRGVRIYWAREGNTYIILPGGGTKRRQQDDIEVAISRWQEAQTKKASKMMVTTRSHSETLKKDLQSSAEFRVLLLAETIKCLTSGDLETGKIVLREYINGTMGFVALGEALGKSPKSLMRMLGPQGNPNARNLLAIIAHLQKFEGGHFEVQFVTGPDDIAA